MSVLPEERRLAIRGLIKQRRVVRADELAERFGVSAETIRRDLVALEREGATRRVYGGAVDATRTPHEAPFEHRRVTHAAEKRAMAEAAASLVDEGDLLILDVGTSVATFASVLAPTFRGRIVTNSILAAIELSQRPDIDLVVSGGRIRSGDMACTGALPQVFFEGIHGGKAFLGSGGVDPHVGLTDYHLDEAVTRRTIVAHASETYVMADSSKMGEIAPIKVCDIDRITAVITDDGIDPEEAARFERAGVRLIVAKVERDRSPAHDADH